MAKAKQQAEQTANMENSFAKPVLQTSQDPNKPKPKIVHLGTLGNAKKRKANEMEGTSQKPDEQNGVSQNKENGHSVPPEIAGGLPTKTDEAGHVEKMVKPSN